jgi:hypothetical protein
MGYAALVSVVIDPFWSWKHVMRYRALNMVCSLFRLVVVLWGDVLSTLWIPTSYALLLCLCIISLIMDYSQQAGRPTGRHIVLESPTKQKPVAVKQEPMLRKLPVRDKTPPLRESTPNAAPSVDGMDWSPFVVNEPETSYTAKFNRYRSHGWGNLERTPSLRLSKLAHDSDDEATWSRPLIAPPKLTHQSETGLEELFEQVIQLRDKEEPTTARTTHVHVTVIIGSLLTLVVAYWLYRLQGLM